MFGSSVTHMECGIFHAFHTCSSVATYKLGEFLSHMTSCGTCT